MAEFLRIKNWSDFQHYKDRRPPWLKLHRALLDNYEFQCLQLASRALAPMLWLLASEADDINDPKIHNDAKWIAFRLRQPLKEVTDGLSGLVAAGFVIVEQDASRALASCYQHATSETETETETETRGERQNTPLPPSEVGCVEGGDFKTDNPTSNTTPFPKPPTPNPTIAPPPPSRSRLTVAQMERFEQWYRQYPKKVSRGQAEKAWLTVEKLYFIDLDDMIKKLEEQKGSTDWLKENGKYIPHPATYLNAKKWLDETDAPESSDDLFDNYVAAGLKAQFG